MSSLGIAPQNVPAALVLGQCCAQEVRILGVLHRLQHQAGVGGAVERLVLPDQFELACWFQYRDPSDSIRPLSVHDML